MNALVKHNPDVADVSKTFGLALGKEGQPMSRTSMSLSIL
jgi:hypothetical protein